MEARSSGADDKRAARNVSRWPDRCSIMMPQLTAATEPAYGCVRLPTQHAQPQLDLFDSLFDSCYPLTQGHIPRRTQRVDYSREA
jgi:hypothetical protein